MLYEVKAEVRDGRPGCTFLGIANRDGTEVTQAQLRNVPLVSLARTALGLDEDTDEFVQRFAELAAALNTPSRHNGRTDEFYRAVGEVAAAAITEGRSARHAIAATFAISPFTADTYLRRARQRGHAPAITTSTTPTSPRRKAKTT
jgi:hypothetical protein